ncbi:hypothetical protein G5S52_00690 [Grimontia sp. S25]|uniref:Uncharacterized protein n=1 Tax=Grimontia sedimenti TaxID=2711294 RepID=A0A6M1R7W7_9GAMM|nr:hypothetical protein [Grimontia sedimenti]NGN96220.1 hypothetical protein [Grimontia sedimenti]
MTDLIKALEMVKKAYKTKPQKPKLTPEQFQQKAKVEIRVKKVLNGTEPLDALAEETTKLLVELAKTFVKEAAAKASQACATLPREKADSVEPDQSDDREV